MADDHSATRQGLGMLLARWGMESSLVASGRAALAAVDEVRARDKRFSAILLNSDLPDLDGLAVAAEIIRRGGHSGVRIVMLMPPDRPPDLARIAGLGLGGWLAKPVVPAELRQAIDPCLETEPAGPDGRTLDAMALPTRCRVLLAEDSRVSQMIVVRLLERIGHTVVVAGHGREAVEAFQREPFDLVLMDLQMPEMDGIQATRAIRTAEAGSGRRVAIVAMTARADAEDREICLAAGMDAVLAKPVRAAEIYAAIRRMVGGTREASASEAEAGRGAGHRIDWVQAWETVGRDPGLLRGLIAGLRAQMPSRITALRSALEEGDLARAAQVARAFESALTAFGPCVAASFAREVDSEEGEAVRRAGGRLLAELEWLMDALDGEGAGAFVEHESPTGPPKSDSFVE